MMLEAVEFWPERYRDRFDARLAANLRDWRYVWLRAVSTAFRDTYEEGRAEHAEMPAPWRA